MREELRQRSAVEQFRIDLVKAENLRVERERDVALMAAGLQLTKKWKADKCVPLINPGISNFRACALEQHSDQFKQNRVIFFLFPKISKSWCWQQDSQSSTDLLSKSQILFIYIANCSYLPLHGGDLKYFLIFKIWEFVLIAGPTLWRFGITPLARASLGGLINISSCVTRCSEWVSLWPS